MKQVGKVTHFYGKIGVAIIEVSDTMKVGDQIKFQSGDHEFEQPVDSMQVEHQNVQEAKSGDVVGLKANEKVQEGALVFKVEE